MNLGNMSERLFELKHKKSEYEKLAKDLGTQIEAIEFQLIKAMDEAGLEKVTSPNGTVSKTTALYPQIKSKQDFFRWAAENDRADLLVLQANRAAFKDYFEMMGEFPDGTEGYFKDKLNIRSK